MKGATGAVCAAVLAGLLLTSLRVHAQTGQITALRAVPAEVHPGEAFYVSGAGFPPHARETITLACPNWYQDQFSNTQFRGGPLGPLTNGKGDFVLFPFKAFALRGISSSTCLFYASVAGNPYGVDNPAQVRIVAKDQPLDKSAVRLDVAVLPVPRLAHSGLVEDIHIRSWPGATAALTLTYTGGSPIRRTVHLDWEGLDYVHIQLPHVTETVNVRVQVRVSLGTHAGAGSGRFVILH